MRSRGLIEKILPPMPIEMLYMVEHGTKPLESACGNSGDLKAAEGNSYSFPRR